MYQTNTMTNFITIQSIDAEIAVKDAEIKKLSLELESLKDQKCQQILLRIKKEDEERERVQKAQFQKIFDEQKSDMTIELLHGDGILKGPVIRTQAEIDEENEAWSDADDIRDLATSWILRNIVIMDTLL